MILQGQQNLEERIVTFLAKKANSTVEDIHRKIAKESRSYSFPAIYKELGKLEFQGVVVKEKKRYSLRLPWVLDFLSLADSANHSYLQSPTLASVFPKEGEKKIWHFSDLLRLNNFWAQTILVLLNRSSSKILYTWMPHSWFNLAYQEQETQYLKSLKHAESRQYLICGGNTPLDHWTEQFWKQSHTEYSFSKGVFENDKDVYWNIVDEYVFKVTLDPEMTRRIDGLYRKVKTLDQIDLSKMFGLFSQRVKAVMTLEHNPKRAELLKNRFKRFFGIREKS